MQATELEMRRQASVCQQTAVGKSRQQVSVSIQDQGIHRRAAVCSRQQTQVCRHWFASSGQQTADRGKSKQKLPVSIQQEVMHRRVAVCSRHEQASV